MNTPVSVYETWIRADADAIWRGLTAAEFTRRYFHRTAIESDFQVGSPVVYRNPDGSTAVDGEVLESDPPHRLVISWHVHYDPAMDAEGPSRVAFDVEDVGSGVCRLRVTHDGFPQDSVVFAQIDGGWRAIMSSLKTLLETGEALPIAGNEEPAAA